MSESEGCGGSAESVLAYTLDLKLTILGLCEVQAIAKSRTRPSSSQAPMTFLLNARTTHSLTCAFYMLKFLKQEIINSSSHNIIWQP